MKHRPPLPRQLRIGPHRWRVTSDPMLRDSAECKGVTVGDLLTIAVATDLAPSMAAEVLLHELLHACAVNLDVDAEAEERLVRGISGPLLDALRRNPQLRRYLLEG